MSTMRIQKFMAQAGVASRRASEKLISEGRVTLNGEVVTSPGIAVDSDKDHITFDGRPVSLPAEQRTVILYKPRGYICSASSAQGKTVLDLLSDIKERLYPIGRLDKDSEGLLLLTNDGELANKLTHPRYNQSKIYEVTVSGIISDAIMAKLNSPMRIDGYLIRPASVTIKEQRSESNKTVLVFHLKEGRNRQIRKMCEAVNLRIHRLTRTQVHTLTLENMRPGEWRNLTQEEIRKLS